MTLPLTRQDVSDAAGVLGCQEAALKAVVEVEAAGNGFDSSGRPKILFEPHIFERELNKLGIHNGDPIIQQARAQGIASPRWNKALYPKTADGRWAQLEAACAIHQEAGLKSASYGMGQVCGFNHKLAGYADVMSYVQAMSVSEGQQLLAMCSFILKARLDDEIRNLDWASFARGYNGPQFHVNAYDRKLERAYLKHVSDPELFWRDRPNHGYAAGEEHSLDDGVAQTPSVEDV